MTGLTVRVDASGLVASDDEGHTVRLPAAVGKDLREAFDRALAHDAASGERLTAGTLGALAEARDARPRGSDSAPPAWQDTAGGGRISLLPLIGRESQRLSDVLAARRSRRRWAPPNLEAVATVLFRCGRVIDWDSATDGYVTTHRPVPSAGARHALDVHLIAGDIDGLPPGAWRFDPLRCDLVATRFSHQGVLARLGKALGAGPPPAALVAVAHLQRTLSRYPTGVSLLWRDAGALLATLQLCATDIGLGSCIAGTCAVLVDEPDAGVIDVGALALGAEAAE